jgi:hypothetical protein
VLWIGRPSPAAIFRRSLSGASVGLLALGFALVRAAAAVIRGGNNNWDRGKAVPPFAAHNVMIAVGAVLWFGLCTVPMLTRPWRARRAAWFTTYVLTDHRALIVEPGHAKAPKVSAFPPDKLGEIRLVECTGGSGDLVFEEERDWNWDRRREAVGFLGLDDVRQSEWLFRKHLGVLARRR